MAGLKTILGGELHNDLVGAVYPPLTLVDYNNFRMHEVLSGLMYVMRFGRRRGTGNWSRVFASSAAPDGSRRPPLPTVLEVASVLARDCDLLKGFDTAEGQSILADWLATSVVTTKNDTGDVSDQVQWVLPLHYFACWVDLPVHFNHMRGVPELLAGMLADASPGVLQPGDGGAFKVAAAPSDNVLLRVLSDGVEPGPQFDQRGDRLVSKGDLDEDALLCALLGSSLKAAPTPIGGPRGEVRVFAPLCPRQARVLRDDISVLMRAYGDSIPPAALTDYLCALLCVNLSAYWIRHVITANALYETAEHGEADTAELCFLIDSSAGQDIDLRRASEQSIAYHTDSMLRYVRTSVGFRLLATIARRQKLRVAPEHETIQHLVDLAELRRAMPQDVHFASRNYLSRIQDAFEIPEHRDSLPVSARDLMAGSSEQDGLTEFDRLVEVLICLQPELLDRLTSKVHTGFTGSAVSYGIAGTYGKRPPRKFYRLSDAALEALVHVHGVKHNGSLAPTPVSVRDFASKLRDRYGFHVSDPPKVLGRLPQELYEQNMRYLKDRLRALGLFTDVSDAEGMQRLHLMYLPTGATSEGGTR